ncbi:hypothetical protein MKW98_002981, partial [Papaver atlanticum]
MSDAERNSDRKGKRKLVEADIESRIHWYPRKYSIDRLPYGIIFPQGCESPIFEESFAWYLDDLQHNVDVKVEECLQQEGTPGHELLFESPVERLRQFFNQPKATPIYQDTSNPFKDVGVESPVRKGGCSRQTQDEVGDAVKRYVTGIPVSSEHPQMGSKEKWVLYAYHPKFGPFEVHEGVAVVADRFLVYGLSRVGFQSITLSADERFVVRQLASQPWRHDDPMHFPVMDALCPATGKIGRAIFVGKENACKENH